MRQFKAGLVKDAHGVDIFSGMEACAPISREKWKRALKTIFEELRADTFSKRHAALRQLYPSLSIYVHLRSADQQQRIPVKKLNRWTEGVRTHAGKLASLLNSIPQSVIQPLGYPKLLGQPRLLSALIDQLRTLERITQRRFSSTPGRKVFAGAANSYLIDRLNQMYFAATGKQGGVGRVHDHHERALQHRKRQQGKADGPFFRLVAATLALVADKQSDEAIFAIIREYMAQIKSEELVEEVNRAISVDLAAVFEAPHSSYKAFCKALVDHHARAKKLKEAAKVTEKKLEKRRRPEKAGLTIHRFN